MIKALYKDNKNKVGTCNSTEFRTQIGLNQVYILSSLLFSVIRNDAVKRSKEKRENMNVGY